MGEALTFDIPTLPKDEIMECLVSGVLGDGATNILQEHLDHPTPAIMMQLCLSMLGKHGIVERTLSQPFSGSLYSVKYPELYANTVKMTNVCIAVKQLIPTLGKKIVLTDFTTPRPKRLQKFIGSCINYFKSWDTNVKVFEEKYFFFESKIEKSQELQSNVEKMQNEKDELKEWLSEHSQRVPQLKKDVTAALLEEKNLMKKKEETDLQKEEAKRHLQQDVTTLEKQQAILSAITADKENLLQKVVASPNRHLERKNKVVEKLKVAEEKHVEMQGNLREMEKRLPTIESMSRLLVDVTQTLKDSVAMQENMKKVQSENQLHEFEIERKKLTNVELGQNIDNLKHRSTTCQERMSRANLRRMQRKAEFEQKKQALERERSVVDLDAGQIDKEVTNIEKETDVCRKAQRQKEEELNNFVKEVDNQKSILMRKMDNYMTEAQKQILNSTAAKMAEKLKTAKENRI